MRKTAIITGGTSGIGHATVEELLRQDWKVTLVARDKAKAESMISSFGDQLQFVQCDLSDMNGVRDASAELNKLSHVDVLINNAGAWFMKPTYSTDGFEMTFALNHLGHFFLTTSILDLLIRSKARVISVSSVAHKHGELDFDDMLWDKRKYEVFKAYGASKLANILFTKELHKRFYSKGLTAFSLHPGVVGTRFGNAVGGWFSWVYSIAKPFMITAEKGARTQLMLATAENVEKFSGQYLYKEKVVSSSPLSVDVDHAKKLWDYSEELIASFRP